MRAVGEIEEAEEGRFKEVRFVNVLLGVVIIYRAGGQGTEIYDCVVGWY